MQKLSQLVLVLGIILTVLSCDKKSPTEPEPPTHGTLIIRSYPSGAAYTIDSFHLSGIAPDTLRDIKAGHYQIQIKLDGYHNIIDTVTIVGGKTETYYSFLKRGYGTIIFNSNPTGAIIIFNGSNLSDTTPYTKENVPTGDYQVKITKSGYADWIDSLIVLMDDTTIVNAELDSLLGWIQITSTPTGADIYIGGSSNTVKAPALDSLPPGTYYIRAELHGFHSATQTVNLSAFDTTKIHFNLELVMGGIRITSTPDGALILVNGLPSGSSTDATLRLVPGDYLLGLRKAGYYDWDSSATVIADDTVDVNVNLEAKTTNLAISSSPSGASIVINGSPSGFNTPHTFFDIASNQYDIRLLLLGYFPIDSAYTTVLGTDNDLIVSFTLAPDISFAYTIGDTIYLANMDGINTDTLSVKYDDWISSYISYQGEIRWSPNGQYLAFSGDEFAVSITDEHGNFLRGFTGNRSMDFAWSPDSDQLVWGVYCGGLYKNVISSNWYGQVTWGCYSNSPAYSPDGNKIMLMYHNWGRSCRIDLMNPDGSSRQNIYGWFGAGFDEHNQLVWITNRNALFKIGGSGIYEAIISDSGSVELNKRVADGIHRFRLSADRQWVAYKTSSGISHMQVGSWNPSRITDLSCYDFTITSGGDYVLCRTSDGVHVIDRDGNSFHIIMNTSAGRGAIDIKP